MWRILAKLLMYAYSKCVRGSRLIEKFMDDDESGFCVVVACGFNRTTFLNSYRRSTDRPLRIFPTGLQYVHWDLSVSRKANFHRI